MLRRVDAIQEQAQRQNVLGKVRKARCCGAFKDLPSSMMTGFGSAYAGRYDPMGLLRKAVAVSRLPLGDP